MRFALACLLLVAGCQSPGATATPPPGNPAAFDRIEALTDSRELQAEFDTASANFDRVDKGTPASAAAVAFMQAVDARMTELGCY